jgi:mRNA-degrading endonuclease RelE of RelBE toxin-antitoxin system
VIEFVQGALAENPHRVGKPLVGKFAGYFSARRGDYRVIYRVDEAERTVVVVRVDHRRNAYR